MKLRVYDSARGSNDRHKYENFVDRYSLYFPYPKDWRLETRIKGDFLSFSFDEERNTINRFIWNEWHLRDGYCSKLGKKVEIKKLPEFVRKWIEGYERVWNNYINNPDDENVEREWNEYN